MPVDIQEDKKKRQYYKLLSCSLLGKVSQSNLFPKDLYVGHGQDFDEYFYSTKGTIEDFDLINASTLYLKFKPNKENAPVNRTGNCVLSAFTTAHGRKNMHQAVMKLVNTGCQVFSQEADALVFLKKKLQKCL